MEQWFVKNWYYLVATLALFVASLRWLWNISAFFKGMDDKLTYLLPLTGRVEEIEKRVQTVENLCRERNITGICPASLLKDQAIQTAIILSDTADIKAAKLLLLASKTAETKRSSDLRTRHTDLKEMI